MAPDYASLKKTLGELIQKKNEDKANEDKIRQEKNDGDRNKILENISGDLKTSLEPVLADLAKNSKLSTDDIRQALTEAIQVNLPEIKFPEIPAPIVNVPAPIVNVPAANIQAPVVNVPAPVVNFPQQMSLKAGAKPFPVVMMDQAGKPMQFPASMGASGGRGDFFTIKDIQNSTGGSLIDNDGNLKVSGSFSVTSSATSTLAQLVNADGVYYSSDNPLPTTASVTLSAAKGQGDAASALRVVSAGDASTSVATAATGLNETTAEVLRVVLMTDTASSVNVALFGGVAPATGLNETNTGVQRTVLMTDTISSVNVVTLNGATPAQGLNENGTGVLKVAQITSVISSVNMVTLNGNAPATGLNETTTGVLRTVSMTDSVSSVVVNSGTLTAVTNITNSVAAYLVDSGGVGYNGSNPVPTTLVSGALTSTIVTGPSATGVADDGNAPVQLGGIARTTNPGKVSGGQVVKHSMDAVGRGLYRPVQVRELMLTAYTSLTTGTESTFLAAQAGFYTDLVYVMGANNSDVAVTVDIRPVTAGNIVMTLQIPANGTAGISCAVPLPASDTGNNWTADMGDITGTTVYLTGLFSKEV